MPGWRKATACGSGPDCVEVAPVTAWHPVLERGIGQNCVPVVASGRTGVLMRDSKNRAGPVLMFTPAEWAAFLDEAKSGEFDDLVAPHD